MEYYQSEIDVNNQLYFCGVPFRLDSYSGCTHNCMYCFARSSEISNQAVKSRKQAGLLVPVVDNFKRLLTKGLDQRPKSMNIIYAWLQHRVPIHWGGMSDPFQPCEAKYKISKNWIEYLNWYQYPVIISTKGTDIIASKEYIDLLKQGKYIVQVSLPTLDESLSILEPNAPSPQDRLRALALLADNGIYTVCRIQPMIPASPIETKLYEFIPMLAQAGVKHVVIEAYKPQLRNVEATNTIGRLYPSTLSEYKYNGTRSFGFESLLPSWRKWQYIKVAKPIINELGMTLGAADNDMRIFGDKVCCCGADGVAGFENFWRYQASQAAWIAREKGEVALADMQGYWCSNEAEIDEQEGEFRDYCKHKGLRTTARNAIGFEWNQGGEQSPEEIAGVQKGNKLDSDGNVIYKWHDPIPRFEAQQVKQPVLL